jgi:hypothetical protein
MKVIDNGLNLYPLRSLNETIKGVANITLPPIYTSFLSLFQVGKDQKMLAQVYLDERYNEKLGVARCVNEKYPDNVFLGSLYLPEESVEITSRIYDANDSIHDQDLFLIGEDASGHNFFMVGTGEFNNDQIFIESTDLSFPDGERITKLFDDVYQFIGSFLIVEIESGIGYGVEYEQLYKNWGEDFWRVKE